jgi:Predicted membrane protein (DUF2214)
VEELTVVTAASSGLVAWWAHLYADTKAVSAGVNFLHLAGILVAGGFAIVTDRASLLLSPEREADVPKELARLNSVHAWVLGGLALVVATGVLQVFSDLHTYLTSLLFWTKMGLIALLLFNGWVRLRAERALEAGEPRAWKRFHLTSVTSLVLWFAVLLAGVFLTTIS